MAKMTFRTNDHTPEKGEWRTFRQWRELNFGVLKGEKARRFVHGVAVFHESQVAYMPSSGEGDFDPYDEIWAMSRECNGW